MEECYLTPDREVPVVLSCADGPTGFALLTNVPAVVSMPELVSEMEAFHPCIVAMRVVLQGTAESYGLLIATASPSDAQRIHAELNLRPITALAKESLFVTHITDSYHAGSVKDLFHWPRHIPSASSSQHVDPGVVPVSPSLTPVFSNTPDAPPVLAMPSPQLGPAADQMGSRSASEHRETSSPVRHDSENSRRSRGTGNSPMHLPQSASSVTTCAVCLDSLTDRPSILLPCEHEFHVECFARVQEDGCPLCRYSVAMDPATRSFCSTCGASHDLWMCLVCGHVSCGRAVNAHAVAHFQETSHQYALQVGGYRVWDYANDTFVHRLIAADEDSDVPVDPATKNAWWFSEEDNDELERVIFESKTEAVAGFYSTLLQEQLEAQSRHYGMLLESCEARCAEADVVEEEESDRAHIVQAAVAGYRKLIASSNSRFLAQSQLFRGHNRQLTKEMGELQTTVDVLKAGNEKLATMLANAKQRQSAKCEPLEKKKAELQREFDQLCKQF